MSSKTLIGFISVGVIAGLLLGLYLLDVKNNSPLVFIDGSSLSLVTEKFDFKKGEEIKIRVVNSGTVPLTFNDSSYGLKISGLSGVLLYSPKISLSDSKVYVLDRREEVEFVWDQIKNDGDALHEGVYKIYSSGFDPNKNKIEKSITITIWK